MLRTDAHRNHPLQADFNQYGEAAFVFEVLEECAPRLLDEREHYWIAELRCIEGGYNIKPSPNEDRDLPIERSDQNYDLEPVVVKVSVELKRNLEALALEYRRQNRRDVRTVGAVVRRACDELLRKELPGYSSLYPEPAAPEASE